MKKRIIILTSIFLIGVLAGCSAEADAIVDYHNNFIENIEEKENKVLELDEQTYEMEYLVDIHEIQQNDIIPILTEIQAFFEEQEPSLEVVKEYHELRVSQYEPWIESHLMEADAIEQLLNDNITEAEFDEIMNESVEIYNEGYENGEKADEKMESLVEEYNLEWEE
ncbi:hypothetical protein [Gracilibacillus saliphilus]|uniref:hypothetical protein n=1 Tax=Gracilibacillus saliphilus TaxID=543890 RepID=UPI0013D082B7|nr:hypothetical protein [Gracilibacillus saliphilus]